jgi:hypothetical protein
MHGTRAVDHDPRGNLTLAAYDRKPDQLLLGRDAPAPSAAAPRS